MSKKFASGKHAKAVCDICGATVKYLELRALVRQGRRTNLMACRDCYEEDHPQLRVRELRGKFSDAEALEHPRPDSPDAVD